MKLRIFLAFCILHAQLLANIASPGPGYTIDWIDSIVYEVDLKTGAMTDKGTVGGGDTVLTDIELANARIGYAIGYHDKNLYEVNLITGASRLVTQSQLPTQDLFGMALANSSTAYVVANQDNSIFRVDLGTGAYTLVTTLPGNPGIADIALLDESTAYVVGFVDNKVYRVDLATGAYSLLTQTAVGSPGGPALAGINLASRTVAYVVGNADGNVYRIDLLTGESSLVTPNALPNDMFIANVGLDGNTLYTEGNMLGGVYAVDLSTGSYRSIGTPPGSNPGLSGMGILLQMGTTGLDGNNLTLAQYLNVNAPINVIRSFALLEAGVDVALEAASPTRNACATYASQNACLASGQVLADHLKQRRLHRRQKEGSQVHHGEPLFGKPYSAWCAPFGEYVLKDAQTQVPAFTMGLAGSTFAMEKEVNEAGLVGIGGTYVFTRVNHDKDMGLADLNQGLFTAYGSWNTRMLHFDVSLSGGYYVAKNQRKISFPGVVRAADAVIDGWQLAPHIEIGLAGLQTARGGKRTFGIEPFVMAGVVANWENGYSEESAGAYNMGQKERFCSLLRAESGIRFNQIVSGDRGNLIVGGKTSYVCQKAFGTGKITAFLVGSPGEFTVEAFDSAQHSGVCELSVLYRPLNNASSYVGFRYQGEFGPGRQSHHGMVELGFSF